MEDEGAEGLNLSQDSVPPEETELLKAKVSP